MVVEFYQENRLARDMLDMDGRPVRMADIHCPVLNIAASRDQIAPRSTTSVITHRVGSDDASEIVIEGGHVGSWSVGPPARTVAEGRRLAQRPRLNVRASGPDYGARPAAGSACGSAPRAALRLAGPVRRPVPGRRRRR